MAESNPFRPTDEPIDGMGKGSDLLPIKFTPAVLASFTNWPAGWESQLLHAYGLRARDSDWAPLTLYNWMMAVELEAATNRGEPPPYHLLTALSVTLGAHAHALRRQQAYTAAAAQAHGEMYGPRLTVAQLAAEAGIDVETLRRLRRRREYGWAVNRLKRLKGVEGPFDWDGDLPHPAGNWLNPKGGRWQDEVEYKAQDIIQRLRQSKSRHAPANLRRAICTMVEWHSLSGRPISSTVLKALGYCWGLVSRSTGELVSPSGVPKQLNKALELAKWAGEQKAATGAPASISRMAAHAGVSRTEVRLWMANPVFQLVAISAENANRMTANSGS